MQSNDGLTVAEILDTLPTDPASILALVLVLAFLIMVFWFGSRGGKSKG